MSTEIETLWVNHIGSSSGRDASWYTKEHPQITGSGMSPSAASTDPYRLASDVSNADGAMVRRCLCVPAIDEVVGTDGKRLAAIVVSDLENWPLHRLSLSEQQLESVFLGSATDRNVIGPVHTHFDRQTAATLARDRSGAGGSRISDDNNGRFSVYFRIFRCQTGKHTYSLSFVRSRRPEKSRFSLIYMGL